MQSRLARLAPAVAAFVISRRAGAMLIGGSIAMLAMVTVGAMLTNYGWREAQEAEIRAALRAGVASASHLMRGDIVAAEQKIKDRVAGVMGGLMDGLNVTGDDIIVQHDFATNRTTITVAGNATYLFQSLWGGGGTGVPEFLNEQVTVEFDASEFEFALALDVSRSMGFIPAGWSVTRLDALKDAVTTIAQIVDDVSTTNPGIITLALVPYSNVVNVADTSGMSQTKAKERYVYMLTGAEYNTHASRNTEGHWVDTFHAYGTGDDMGPLASRDLPDFLTVTDWYLHQPGSDDVSDQVPTLGMWDYEGEDFWNGCVMARWGAYWDTAARPVVWDPADPANWPARTTVAGWEPGSTGISNLPLHLSDAPPDASDPNTRFTAYSWPDARIRGMADGHLDAVMRKTLDPTFNPIMPFLPASENHWHLRAVDRGGSLLCPEAPIVPLTDDITALQAVNSYVPVQPHSLTLAGQTFLHLGVVWGLRALSPLWRDVWSTKSVSGDDLPRTPCLAGTSVGCSQLVQKAIVIVSDGANYTDVPRLGRSFSTLDVTIPVTRNPPFSVPRCQPTFNLSTARALAYQAAMTAPDPTAFAASFDVDPTGRFTSAGMSDVLDGWQVVHPLVSTLNPAVPSDQVIINAYRIVWENALKDMTPWQLFRGYDDGSPSKSIDAADTLVDPANQFGIRGRPVQHDHYCRLMSPVSAYGQLDDVVRVGDSAPVSDVAPFSLPGWTPPDGNAAVKSGIISRLDDWFREACDIAGQRGVRIHAIYIGRDVQPWEKAAIALLEECVDRGYGSSPVVDEVHVTPTAQALKDAVEDIMDIRRTLRFVDP